MADPAAAAAVPMTIDFLRARLLSERSVSRASKERADQLAARVAELEEQVRAVTAQRRQAEREAAEVLAVLVSRGFYGSLSDVLDSDSDDADEEEERDEPRDATVTTGDPAPRSHGEEAPEQEQPPAKGGTKEEEDAMSGTALQPGGLSWKGRCASPRRARQLKQRHRRSYVYFLASQPDPSPKYRMGQSCRKNKRKELSSVAAVVAESRKEQRDGPRCPDDDGRAEFDGEVGGDDRRSSGDGGQYVMRRDDGDGEMERVLEKQAELIGQYEAQEKAQTDWEKKFNDTRSSPNKGDVEADCQLQTKSGGEKLLVSRTPKNASEEMGRADAVSAQGSSSYGTATRQSQGDANSDGCSSHHTNSASSSGLGAVKAPSESSPSVSKVSDWSSSRFHDHADDQHGNIDVESVLQALQRARISLRQKLDRPLPPSQVTLALPAPGDEYRADLYDDDGANSSCRDGHGGSSPSRQEILALGAPEDYHGYHDHGREESLSVDGADTSLMEKPSGSSPPRQEILALPAPGDDRVPDDDIQDDDVKIPVSSPGLFRLPTDSFPKEETQPAISNGHDTELGLIEVEAAQHDAYRDDGAGVLLFRLPTDSFPKDEGLPTSNGHDFELALREAAQHDACGDDDAGVSARHLYDPHGSAATSGRCSVPPGSGFTVGGALFLSGIPGLPEDLRKGGGPMQPRLRVHHF